MQIILFMQHSFSPSPSFIDLQLSDSSHAPGRSWVEVMRGIRARCFYKLCTEMRIMLAIQCREMVRAVC